MHIFFSGIGGSGIGPLAVIAKQAGYEVSGSDKQASVTTESLLKQGIELYIGQSKEQIAAAHEAKPIDWLVYSSALSKEDPNHPELQFATEQGIKHTKRDELLNQIIADKNLSLIGVAGTHGKSTTTSMVIWLFHELGQPISYSVGAKLPFGPAGQLVEGSKFFVYECDEFDRNFLAFHPALSLITGIGWDHHEIFPTRESYIQAFHDFIGQSAHSIIWQEDLRQLNLSTDSELTVLDEDDPSINTVTLPGVYNRQDAWQAVMAVHTITHTPTEELVAHINRFPGLKQRMEQLAPNLYTNYAHTPEKIKGGMHTALDVANEGQDVVVIYEPLTNRRQHYIKQDYKDSFAGAKKLYWVPTYLAREDPNLPHLSPAELIPHLDNPSIAEPAELNDELLHTVRRHLEQGDMVVAMGASGTGSLDEWLRAHFTNAG